MPNYHVHLSYVSKGQVRGGAKGFHQYVRREGVDAGQDMHRYLIREHEGRGHGKDDLILSDHGSLPSWAEGPQHFWQQADTLERKNGPLFWHLQVTLPRELSPAGREQLARDVVEVVAGRYPHSFALHEPTASDGHIQPHLHLQFSSRRDDEQRELTPEQWFKQPNHGGTWKDPSWFQKQRVYDIREAVAVMTNCALQREGIALAVNHRRLKDRGLERSAPQYGVTHPEGWEQMSTAERKAWRTAEKDQVLAHRAMLSASGVRAYEAFHDYQGWKDQAVKLLSLERQYVTDLCRDYVWRHDRSEARMLERQQSMERTLDLAMARHDRTPQRPSERTPARDLERSVHGLAAGLVQDDAPGGAGLHVRLWDKKKDRERGDERGLGW
jgi:hypothetical protein